MPLSELARRVRRRVDAPVVIAALAAATPVVVAAVVALAQGWIAVGDNGYFLLRSREVFSTSPPLLGTWTSSSTTLGFDVNNPGPMLFFLLAIPVTLGESAGLVVGAAMLNVASIAGIAWVLRRNAGTLVAVLGLLAAAGLGWSMGRPLLVDPWQPHSLLFAFLAFLVLAWAVAAGDRWALPWAVGVASLLVQTHLSYVYVVPAVGLVAVAGLAWGALELRRGSPELWPSTRTSLVRAGATGVAVALVCWLPSLIQQVSASGRGNLTLLVDASRAGAPTVGAEVGIREVANVLAIWPTWLRPSFEDGRHAGSGPGLAVSLVALGVLAAVLAAAGWWAWRRRDRFALAGIAVAATAVLAGTYTATGVIDTVFGVAGHHVRYLWPIAILVQLSVVVVVARALGAREARRAVTVVVVAVAVVALATLPDVERPLGPNATRDAAPAVAAMNRALGGVEGRGTLLVELENRPFAEPFSGPLLAELDRRGVDFVVEDSGEVHQLGTHRDAEGRELDGVIVLRWGRAPLVDPPEGEEIVVAWTIDDDELDRWWRLRDEVAAALGEGALVRTEAGERAAASGAEVPATGDGVSDPESMIDGVAFFRAVEEGWVSLEGVAPSSVHDWLLLDERVRAGTVGIWLLPAPGS